jgi:hypothetical protein
MILKEVVLGKKREEEIAVLWDPEVVKGWPKVISRSHIVERGSSARLGLANQFHQATGREIVSGMNLHATSRGTCVRV